MPQNFTQVLIRGLSTYISELTQQQPNYLQDCNNIVINKDNIAEPRRGLKLYGNAMGISQTDDIAHQLLTYKKRILRHYGVGSGDTLEFDDGSGNFSAFDGTYSEVDEGLRIKGVEVNGNFYFTTNDGIKKISASSAAGLTTAAGFITDSGGVKALDLGGSVNYNETGFFTQDSVVAYRVVWGIKDVNSNLILGFPSSRFVIFNPITNLLEKDVNKLLNSLDVAAAANGGGTLSDTDYLQTYKLSVGSNADDIYTALVGLCSKLDADIGGTTYTTIAGTHTLPPANPVSSDLLDLQSFYDQIVDALLSESIAHITVAAQTAGNFQNSTQSATVDLVFTIPQNVNSDAYFYQVYRTAVTSSSGSGALSDLDPGDEMGLVYEANTTAAERSVGLVSFTDIVPESFRGANLYTNPQSGDGILQANEVPPLAKDIALFKNSVFYANTRTKHKKSLSLLGVANFVSGVSSIAIVQGSTVNTYTFYSPVAEVTDISFVAGSLYTSSGTSDYFDLYSGNDTNHYRVWFQAGTSVAPSSGGATLVQITITGAETSTQAAQKGYEALNVFDDFMMTYPVTQTLTVTNTQQGPATTSSENVADAGFIVTVTTPGDGEDPTNHKVLLSDAATPAQQVDETARSLVRVINRNMNDIVYGFYLSGPSDVPGIMNIEARELGTNPFYLIADSIATGESFTPILSPTNFITAISMANPTHVTSVAHGLSSGDQIIIANSDSTPKIDGIQTVTIVDVDHFTIPVNVTVAGTTGVFELLSSAEASDNEVSPNRVYYSKFQQPEAVPIVNYFDVGPKDKAISRIIPLRDSLFILKEDAIYRVTGDSSDTGFTQALFDSSAFIQAPDSAAVLNNQIFMFTNQGIALVTDTGVSIMSRNIENLLLPLLLQPNFSTATFGVSYESDRSYLCWTTTNTEDTIATQCFRYNTFTNAWTKWEISKTCGIVSLEKLYTGAADTNFIEVERKSFDRVDYADREFDKDIASASVFGNKVNIGSVADVSVFDVLYQEQYLTIYKLNQLLKKLDDDVNVSDDDYLSTLGASNGSNLRDILTLLATKLDADTGIGDSTFSSGISGFGTTFLDTQNAYNVIINKLNLSNASFSNYQLSVGTVKYEAVISSINKIINQVTLDVELPLIEGPILIYQHIPTRIIFNPQYFNDSELFKQVSEAKFMFERTNFSNAIISYSSDDSPSFEEFEFSKQGPGAFGFEVFGETNFGGNANKTPLRTLIPRGKQRCRFIVPKIEHFIAREKMSVNGYSMFYTPYSQRAYKN